MTWYNDVRDAETEAGTGPEIIHDAFDCTMRDAVKLADLAKEAFDRGAAGEEDTDDALQEWIESRIGWTSDDFEALIRDAWHEGCVSRKLTIKLDSETDGCCNECGNSVASYEDECRGCGAKDSIQRMVMVSVDAPFAHVWADHDQTIDGSSWETPSDMPHFAYTILPDDPCLVGRLREEGYTLDLSEYDGDDD